MTATGSRTAGTSRWRVLAERLGATVRVWSPSSDRPLPRVRAAVGWWVPIWFVRLLVAGLASGAAMLVVQGPVGWTVMAAIITILALFPQAATAGAYAIGIGISYLASGVEPFSGTLFVLVLSVHLVVTIGTLVAGLPGRARLQVAALVGPMRRFTIVQFVAQALALLGAFVTAWDLTVVWLPVIAVQGLAALGWWLLAWLEATADDGDRWSRA